MGLKLTQRVFSQSFGTGMATARIQALFLQRSGGDECMPVKKVCGAGEWFE
jgi:hypothetical protein